MPRQVREVTVHVVIEVDEFGDDVFDRYDLCDQIEGLNEDSIVSVQCLGGRLRDATEQEMEEMCWSDDEEGEEDADDPEETDIEDKLE